MLLAADVPDPAGPDADLRRKRFINFEEAENLAEGKYSTYISLEHAIDPPNNVILAY